MTNVNAQFHSLVTDGQTEQVLLMVECNKYASLLGNFYLSSDGDFHHEGAKFVDEMSSSENYSIGCVPSRTMSASLMNLDGSLNGHNFGWLMSYIGVLYYEEKQTLEDTVYSYLDYVFTPEKQALHGKLWDSSQARGRAR